MNQTKDEILEALYNKRDDIDAVIALLDPTTIKPKLIKAPYKSRYKSRKPYKLRKPRLSPEARGWTLERRAAQSKLIREKAAARRVASFTDSISKVSEPANV